MLACAGGATLVLFPRRQPIQLTQDAAFVTESAGHDGAVPAISMRGIVKRFPGVIANDHVDFDASQGEVHALLGENGAGKTTLSNVLSGLYQPDEGQIELYGAPAAFHSPRDALAAGISMVHQHFRLVERFTVVENLLLGDQRHEARRFRIRPRLVDRKVRELSERYGLVVDPQANVWQLSIGEQQRVEILNALYQDARILILDEPTAVLTPQEAKSLFATLRTMAAEGRTVVFISHKLHEVKAVSDRITVLREGRSVATVSTESSTSASLAALMVGHDVETAVRSARSGTHDRPVLQLEDLWVDGDRETTAVRGVTLTVRAGEIVAIAGVSGNGQRELAEAAAGLSRPARGRIRVGGQLLHGGDPREAYRAGIAYVPEDRLGTGAAPGLSIAANLALKSYRKDSAGPLLRKRAMTRCAQELIGAYEIKAPGPGTPVDHLSGGNVQKLVLAREFSGDPKVLVVASATRGLDVAAVGAVHRHLIEAASRGVAVLLISEDLDEILALNDRILVMYEGRLTEVPDRSSVAEIGLLMAGEMTEGQRT